MNSLPEGSAPSSPPPANPRPWQFSLGMAFVGMLAVGVVLGMLMRGVRAARENAFRQSCSNNLKQIALALQTYRSHYGCFPPAYHTDAQGKRTHSWRTLIVRYLESSTFSSMYSLDEPWDGPTNRALHTLAPMYYRCPIDAGPDTHTSYVAVVGPRTTWPPGKRPPAVVFPGKARPTLDPAEQTLLIVEVANSGIHWMEPRDLEVGERIDAVNTPHGNCPSSLHPGGALAAMADGTIRFLPNSLTVEELRAILTVAGGEPLVELKDGP